MTKTRNQIFFFLHQDQNIFFRNIGNQNMLLEKKHNPSFKLNGRSLSGRPVCDDDSRKVLIAPVDVTLIIRRYFKYNFVKNKQLTL